MSPKVLATLLVAAAPAAAAEVHMVVPTPHGWELDVVGGHTPTLRFAPCGGEDDLAATPLDASAWLAPEGTFCEVVLTWREPLVLDVRGPGERSLEITASVGEVHITLDEPVTLRGIDEPWVFALGNGAWLRPAEAWLSAHTHRVVDAGRAERGHVTSALRAAAFGPIEDGLDQGRTDAAWGITTP